ncbi:transposase [Streptomyces sp. NPDC001634]|uniref:transposase n=1 Tax=Streptomyces sp. NPDC001634 TaxID=3154390 RepID=UPI00332AE27B
MPVSSTSCTASCLPNSTRPANSTGPARAWTAPTFSRKKEGPDTGPSPVDRRKTGSKHHLICDGRGTPLKVITTAANVNDVTQTLALVDGIPPVAGRPGRPRRRPDSPRDQDPTHVDRLGVLARRRCPAAGDRHPGARRQPFPEVQRTAGHTVP